MTDLALRIGKSVSYVTKRIKLLDLPAAVLESITSGKLNTSIAEELYLIKDKAKQSELAKLISNRRLSLRNSRKLLTHKDETFTAYHPSDRYDEYSNRVRVGERSFDKSITAVRIAMNCLSDIINSVKEDWILHEVLLQHKNMLHTQIDILFKQKRKL